MLTVDTRGGAIGLLIIGLLLLGETCSTTAHTILCNRKAVRQKTMSKQSTAASCTVVNVCAGTWGALLNLAERKGRHTAHTWMDFSIGFFAVSLVCGL